jgi:hypothetical protein
VPNHEVSTSFYGIANAVISSIRSIGNGGPFVMGSAVSQGEISGAKKLFLSGRNRPGGVGLARMPAEGIFQKIVHAVAVRISVKICNLVGVHPGGQARRWESSGEDIGIMVAVG